MGFFDALFGSGTFVPDYRDVILYNGTLPFRATGRFKGNLIEFEQFNNPKKVIYFNTNLTRQQYIERRSKFQLYRNKDSTDFSDCGFATIEGSYLPTGRRFESNQGHLYEHMKVNDPTDVQYLRLPFADDNWIIGEQCLSLALKRAR